MIVFDSIYRSISPILIHVEVRLQVLARDPPAAICDIFCRFWRPL